MSALTVANHDPAKQLGPVQPHVADAGRILAAKFGITTMGGWRASAVDKAGHPAGLAIDVPATRALGDQVAKFATDNARALGVKYVIWQQAIWTTDKPTWTPMASRPGDGPGYDPNHLRHVHISFTSAAPDASLAQRLRAGLSGAVEAVTGGAGAVAERLNPFDDWADQGLALGVKLAGVGAGLALLVVGLNRLVAPALTSATERTIDRATEVLT